MIAIPAIDLRDGACVQLVGGSYDDERVRLDDPLAVARGWQAFGFTRLHVVDLDAAMGRGNNAAIVHRLIQCASVDIRVGGGVRTTTRAAELLALGASEVIVGTRALEDPRWLREVAESAPRRVIVAVDIRDRQPVVRGWNVSVDRTLTDVIGGLDDVPIAGLLITAVHVEGQQNGPDLALVEQVRSLTTHPLTVAGGIASLDDLRTLASIGVDAAVIGMALYTERIDAAQCAAEFGGRK